MASILFVDDDALTLNLLSQAAKILGQTALTAPSIEKAFKLAQEQQPDLIVTDVNLESGNGLDFISTLSQDPGTSHIPVMTLSALHAVDIESQARERGAVACLSKPIRLQTLLEVICEYTEVKT